MATSSRAGRVFSLASPLTVVAMALLAACSGRCGEDRAPLEMPNVGREGGGLIGAHIAGPADDGSEEGTGRPRAVRGADAQARPPREDPVIAWVNDVQIHRSELEIRFQRRLDLSGANREEPGPVWRNRERRRIARELVDNEMLRQCMAQEGIQIADADLEAALSEEIERVFQSEAHFERYLRRRNLTREAYAENKRFELGLHALLESRGPLETGEEEVRQYYERFRENWRAPERLRASTIAVRLAREASEQDVEAARARLLELRARVVDRPDELPAIAREHSQSPDRYRGGDMGWIYRDEPDLPSEVADPLFALEVGTVSEPLRTPLGLQIFIVHDRRPEGYRELDEVRDRLFDIVRQRTEQTRRMSITHELERRYEVGYNEEEFGLEPE